MRVSPLTTIKGGKVCPWTKKEGSPTPYAKIALHPLFNQEKRHYWTSPAIELT